MGGEEADLAPSVADAPSATTMPATSSTTSSSSSSSGAIEANDVDVAAPPVVEGDAQAPVQPIEPEPAPDCLTCSAVLEDPNAEGVLCTQGQTKTDSMAVYLDYLGCMCSQPCAEECGSDLCGLIPKAPSKVCLACMSLSNAACGSIKQACAADK